MPPYRTPVKVKPKVKARPANGAAQAVAAAVRTGTRAAARPAPRPRPKVVVKARVKANPKPKPFVLKGAGDSKRTAVQNHPSKPQKRLDTGRAVGLGVSRTVHAAVSAKMKASPGDHFTILPAGTSRLQKGLKQPDPVALRAQGAIVRDMNDPSDHTGQTALARKADAFVMPAHKAAKAAAVKVLEQTTRINHAEAGAARAAIKGENVPRAASRGIQNKDKYTFSDVLDSAGVHNKIIKGAVGFGLDVGLDPTTFLSGGTNVPAKEAAKAAAEGAEKKALKAGLSPARAKNFGAMAARQAAKDDTRGVTVGLRAHVPFTDKGVHVKTSGKTTARVGRNLKKTTPGKAAAKQNAKVRDVLHETLAPDVTPSFRTRAEHQAIRTAETHARASIASGERAIIRRSKALRKTVDEGEAAQVRTAIETNTVHTLPQKLQDVARSFEHDHAQRLAAEQQRGLGDAFVPAGPRDAQGFFPHTLTPKGEEDVVAAAAKPARSPKPGKARVVRLPFDEAVKVTKEGTYVQDAVKADALHALKSNRNVHLSDMWTAIAKTGRKLTPKEGVSHGEAVYEITATDGPRLVAKANEPDRIAALAATPGKYVIFNKKSVDNVLARQPSRGTHAVTRIYDRAQGGVKKFQTVYRPGYHSINFVGDTANARLHDTNIRSFGQSRRALKAQGAKNRYERSSEAVTVPGPKAAKAKKLLDKKINVGKAGTMTNGELLQLAEKHGAINTGQVQAEIRGLVGDAATRAGRHEHKFSEWRENVPRLATFRQALADGKSAEAAATHSLKAHIDYSDLSPFERKYLRRLFQFYTFYARNSRIQAARLVQRPGKFATVQKALEETSKAAGYGSYSDYVQNLPDYNQRGLPVPVKVAGRTYPVFLQPPTTDLQSLSPSPKEQFQNVASRLSTFKIVPEILANYSIFFQGPIEDAKHPLVKAPAWVGALPDPVRKTLGVDKIVDKATGKKVWAWPAKVDYVAKALPQTNLATSTFKPGADYRGLNGAFAGGSFLTGIKVGPDKTTDNQINQTYAELTKVGNRISALNQKGVNKDHSTREYRDLLKKRTLLGQQAYQLKKDRGDKVLPKVSKTGGFFPKGSGSKKFFDSGPKTKSFFGGN